MIQKSKRSSTALASSDPQDELPTRNLQMQVKVQSCGSIPASPTNLISYQYVRQTLMFQSEHLFGLTALLCAP